MFFFRSLHQPMNLSTQRLKFLWLSWGTGIFWMHSRSGSLYLYWCYCIRSYNLPLYKGWFDESLCMSSGDWWRDDGEAVCSNSRQDWSKHSSHPTDSHCHSCFGRLLEWGMWEVIHPPPPPHRPSRQSYAPEKHMNLHCLTTADSLSKFWFLIGLCFSSVCLSGWGLIRSHGHRHQLFLNCKLKCDRKTQ